MCHGTSAPFKVFTFYSPWSYIDAELRGRFKAVKDPATFLEESSRPSEGGASIESVPKEDVARITILASHANVQPSREKGNGWPDGSAGEGACYRGR